MKGILFAGSATALVTPFNADNSINFDVLDELVEDQIQKGTSAIVACGTTSESATMTGEEHLEVIKHIISRVDKRIPVIAGTGSNDTKFCVELSVEARDVGADGLLVVTPYYNKTSQKGLVEHFNYVANEVKMPIIAYNVPSRTGMNILPETYYEISKNPYIVATKEANGSVASIAKTISLCGDNLHVYSGEDDMTMPIMALGGKGVISVFSNALPYEMQQITTAMLDGNYDEARRIFLDYVPLMEAFFMDVNPVPVKYAMNKMGIKVGPCRMPLTTMTQDNEMKMDSILNKYGLI